MPPSTIFHLGHIVATLRRSPASVASSSSSSHHRADGTLPRSSAGSEFVGRHRAERVLNSQVPCVRYLIGWIVKTYDYINRVVLTLLLSVYEGTWTHSPLSLLCITMILRVRRIFFEITTFPNRGFSDPDHTILPQRVSIGARPEKIHSNMAGHRSSSFTSCSTRR